MDHIIKRLFGILRRYANKQQPSQQGSGLVFGLCLWMKLVLGTLSVALFLLGLLVWVALTPQGGPYFVLLVPFGLLLAIRFATPDTVATDEDGVRQIRWVLRKAIPWSEVVEAVRNPDSGCTEVRGKWGAMISFSLYLVAQDRFESEVLIHTQLKEIPSSI